MAARRALLGGLLALLLAVPALADRAVPGASDMARLRALKMPIVIPAWVPPGFRLVKVEAVRDKRFGTSYALRYRNGNKRINVESASGGIGDVLGFPKEMPFKTPLFGKGALQYDPKDNASNTGWMTLPGRDMPVYQVNGSGVDPRDVIRAAQSLKLAKGTD